MRSCDIFWRTCAGLRPERRCTTGSCEAGEARVLKMRGSPGLDHECSASAQGRLRCRQWDDLRADLPVCGFIQDFAQIVDQHRLAQESHRSTSPEKGVVILHHAGHEHHLDVRLAAQKRVADGEPIETGHEHVEEDDVGLQAGKALNDGESPAAHGRDDLMVAKSNELRKEVTDQFVVVGDENAHR